MECSTCSNVWNSYETFHKKETSALFQNNTLFFPLETNHAYELQTLYNNHNVIIVFVYQLTLRTATVFQPFYAKFSFLSIRPNYEGLNLANQKSSKYLAGS